ncbi:XRE family transcriptional regulator [Flavobacterium cheongpyeongense]|jgi:transcriptional regulator with XRE-family HTH domain|uniref:XRE family transcriptional regulator n=1 Tax=Flavobacterium cheongpyeongense TaxID=2212651 RepID=A0A2V4C526_9FLAO|nr:helix-turn-helix transcriptional regulator [Flavobacterium cheongpyeongense]PXY41304.1 XRE family transcriptional regulator [Flavobacterium cheongpyeongense]
MLNTDEFVKRLESLLEYYALSVSAFADKIGVQRSSMSHLLSGRNKPSLDFIMKILEVFPDVDLYWILTGKGHFPKRNNEIPLEISKVSSQISSHKNTNEDSFSKTNVQENSQIVNESPSELKNNNFDLEDKQIEKIVLFYKNGTFKAYSL